LPYGHTGNDPRNRRVALGPPRRNGNRKRKSIPKKLFENATSYDTLPPEIKANFARLKEINPELDYSSTALVLAFLLVETFDSFSLLGGKLYGRTPLVPRLSPRKTWEGLATGVAAVAVALLSLVAWLGIPLVPMLLAGTIVIIAAVAGDLLGSRAKRQAGVKDYPAVMSVQGCLLDIADAWLVAGPCLAGLAILVGLV
jgi:CDP-diglyceride synthetase